MRSRLVGENVDLALFSDRIEAFLKAKGLETRRDTLGEGYAILGTVSLRDMHIRIIVRILGNAHDFEVDFNSKEPARTNTIWGPLMTLLGGGSFLLRNLKSREAVEKLEREFWIYVSEAVTKLRGSGKLVA